MTNSISDVLKGLRGSGRTVVLFGAGDIGKLAHHALNVLGVAVAGFCDSSPVKQGTQWRGSPIWAPEELAGFDQAGTTVFICNNYLQPVSKLLADMGFDDIHDCSELLDGVDFGDSDLGMDPVFVERKVALHKRECRKAREWAGDALVLKYLDVVVTEACSMKCQDCSNLMQYYTKPRHSDLDLLERAVDRVMAAIDRIYEFRVLGGEPFVNPNVHRVMRKLTSYDQVDKVVVYTNATIVPRNENLDCLTHEKVVVDITNYGALSKKYDQMIEAFEANGVRYLTKVPEWTDSGRINHVERPAEELDEMFRNCCVNDVLTLLNGKLYRCPFSANGTNLGAIPHAEADVIDLTSAVPAAEVRTRLRSLYARTTHLMACNYCNGRDFSTPKIEAAIQTRRPLPLLVVR